MASLFRKVTTRPLPAGATVAGGVATWVDAKGKQRTAPVVDRPGKPPRIRVRSRTWYGSFTTARGITRHIPTGCTDKGAAMHVLSTHVARESRVKSGVITRDEARAAEHAGDSVAKLVERYLADLAVARGRGAKVRTSAEHVANYRRALTAAVADCGFRKVQDLDRDSVEMWARDAAAGDDAPSARTLNIRLSALSAFGQWLRRKRVVSANPFERLEKITAVAPTKRRRALTAAEIERLLRVAAMRPVAEFGRGTVAVERAADATRRSRATWRKAELSFDTLDDAYARGIAALVNRPDYADALARRGRERAMVYRVLLTTGLRRGELASITLGAVRLDATPPHVHLRAEDAKGGREADQPLRADVAHDLGEWIAAAHAGHDGSTPLFDVPRGLVRILDRDLRAAGIPKVDGRGRTVDVHAMRTTFDSHLLAAGASPVAVQKLMRHSTLALTTGTYLDDALVDGAAVIASLPAMPIAAVSPVGAVAPTVALRPVQTGHNGGYSCEPVPRVQTHDTIEAARENKAFPCDFASSGDRTRTGDTRLMNLGPRVLSHADVGLTATDSDGCTSGCTRPSRGASDLELIAAVVRAAAAITWLSADQRDAVVRGALKGIAPERSHLHIDPHAEREIEEMFGNEGEAHAAAGITTRGESVDRVSIR